MAFRIDGLAALGGGDRRALTREQVKAELARAREMTELWKFKGGTGMFFRDVTLPDLVTHVLPGNRRLTLQIDVVDPTSSQACDYFCRSQAPFSPPGTPASHTWTPRRVQHEVYATVLKLCVFKAWHPQLRISAAVSQIVTPSRIDMSDNMVLITGKDQIHPGEISPKHSRAYDRCSEDLECSFEQARKLRTEAVHTIPITGDPTPVQARALLQAVGLPVPDDFGDQDIDIILRKAGFHAASVWDDDVPDAA